MCVCGTTVEHQPDALRPQIDSVESSLSRVDISLNRFKWTEI